jgi:hypothetical protein
MSVSKTGKLLQYINYSEFYACSLLPTSFGN